MRVILAGGGTGGHLYPGIALADKLADRGVEFLFVVSDRGIEGKILSQKGYPYIEQSQTPINNVSIFIKIMSLFKLIKNIISLWLVINRHDKVVLFGGFASAASGFTGILKRCEIYLHEQNSYMGSANRLFSKYAKKVFLSFDTNEEISLKYVLTGNPVRKEFSNGEVKERIGKTVLILGGSQGSRFINKLLAASSRLLLDNGYHIIHQTGLNLYEETREYYFNSGVPQSDHIEIVPYIDDVKRMMDSSDIIISRAGSGGLFEIMYSKRAAIFIPFKNAADNHQFKNAKSIEKRGSAVILTEDEAVPERLLEKIRYIEANYESIKKNLMKHIYIDSAELILKEMEL